MNYFYGLKHPIYTLIISTFVFAFSYASFGAGAPVAVNADNTTAPYVQTAE